MSLICFVASFDEFSADDADRCAVTFSKTERKTVKPMVERYKSRICKDVKIIGGS
jgi:hypothetical protein